MQIDCMLHTVVNHSYIMEVIICARNYVRLTNNFQLLLGRVWLFMGLGLKAIRVAVF